MKSVSNVSFTGPTQQTKGGHTPPRDAGQCRNRGLHSGNLSKLGDRIGALHVAQVATLLNSVPSEANQKVVKLLGGVLGLGAVAQLPRWQHMTMTKGRVSKLN